MIEPTDPFPVPDDQQTQMMEHFREQSEVFAQDLTTYKQVIDRVEENERRLFVSTAPPGYDIPNTVEFDVAHGFYAGLKVLRDMGAELVIMGPEAIDNKIIQDPEHYVSVRTKDKLPVDILMDIYVGEHDPIFGIFEFGTQNRVPGMFNNNLAERLAMFHNPKLAALQQSGLIERGQMKDTLIGAVTMLRKPDLAARASDKLKQEEAEAIAKYEELRKKGVRPLGLEETYGLMTGVVRDYLARHPDKHLQLTRGSN